MRTAPALFALVLLAGCLENDEEITVRPDGSATDWTERLREAGRTIATALPIWTAAAGFAAGLVATAVLARPPAVERAPTTWERFHTDAPPPLATTEGQLARLGEYLRR